MALHLVLVLLLIAKLDKSEIIILATKLVSIKCTTALKNGETVPLSGSSWSKAWNEVYTANNTVHRNNRCSPAATMCWPRHLIHKVISFLVLGKWCKPLCIGEVRWGIVVEKDIPNNSARYLKHHSNLCYLDTWEWSVILWILRVCLVRTISSMHCILIFTVDKHCVKPWWHNTPMCVPLLQLNHHTIYDFQVFRIAGRTVFDSMENGNRLKREKSISCLCAQHSCWGTWVVHESNEVC